MPYDVIIAFIAILLAWPITVLARRKNPNLFSKFEFVAYVIMVVIVFVILWSVVTFSWMGLQAIPS